MSTPSELVTLHLPFAAYVARRYRHRGESHDDLTQVAYLALTEAAHRFDATRGSDFRAFAVVWIDGALRHHFRDHTWMVRPPRRLVALRAAVAERSGSPAAEVAAELGVSVDDVHRVRRLASAYVPVSLDAHPGGLDALPWSSAHVDPYEQVHDRVDLAPALRRLDARERRVVVRRFRDGWTQDEIARELGVSQMQVPRVLKRVVGVMGEALG